MSVTSDSGGVQNARALSKLYFGKLAGPSIRRDPVHLPRLPAVVREGLLEVIEQAYLPNAEEIERARETVARLERGSGTLGTGEFVDAAMLGAARQTLALADTYGSSHRPPQGRNT
jgi:hypothetical protein